jgi:CBS domain containing-hemolysin-like protein
MDKVAKAVRVVVEKAIKAGRWLDDRAYNHRLKTRVVKTRRELVALAHNSTGVIAPREARVIEALLRARTVKVRDLMTPLAKIRKLAAVEPLSPLLIDELYKTGQATFLVYNEEKTVGIVKIYDMVNLDLQRETVADVVRPLPPAVATSIGLIEAMEHFGKLGADVLLVLADDGRAVGLLELNKIIKKLGF